MELLLKSVQTHNIAAFLSTLTEKELINIISSSSDADALLIKPTPYMQFKKYNKTELIKTYKMLLSVCEQVPGKFYKSIVVSVLMRICFDDINFLLDNQKFKKTVFEKLVEFKREYYGGVHIWAEQLINMLSMFDKRCIYGYKGFDHVVGKGIHCKNLYYKFGVPTKHEGDIIPGKSGLHFCPNLENVFKYYDPWSTTVTESPHRYCEVQSNGNYIIRGSKVVTDNLTVVRLLNETITVNNNIYKFEDGIIVYIKKDSYHTFLNKKGQIHRKNKPALFSNNLVNDFNIWVRYGKVHRNFGPAYVDKAGNKIYYNANMVNRQNNKPAVILANNVRMWVKLGILYRVSIDSKIYAVKSNQRIMFKLLVPPRYKDCRFDGEIMLNFNKKPITLEYLKKKLTGSEFFEINSPHPKHPKHQEKTVKVQAQLQVDEGVSLSPEPAHDLDEIVAKQVSEETLEKIVLAIAEQLEMHPSVAMQEQEQPSSEVVEAVHAKTLEREKDKAVVLDRCIVS